MKTSGSTRWRTHILAAGSFKLLVAAVVVAVVATTTPANAQGNDGPAPAASAAPADDGAAKPPPPIADPGTGPDTRVVPPKLPIQELPPGTSSQDIHLKLVEGTVARVAGGRLEPVDDPTAAAVNAVLAEHFGTHIERMFDRPDAELAEEKRRGEQRSGRQLADLTLWLQVGIPAEADPVEVINALLEIEGVETAYAEPIPVTVPVTPDYRASQDYPDAAPTGVDRAAAWATPGGSGANVKIIDIEYNWNLSHEDLVDADVEFIPNGTFCDTFNDTNHGTAVLGEMVGADNGFGVTGLVPDADIAVVNALRSEGGVCSYRLAQAINTAAANLSAGDLILLEQQISGPDPTCNNQGGSQNGLVAVEWAQAYYDAIVAAVADGIIVVEAAGNGSCNYNNAVYGNPFPAGRPDSGAIIVGAGGHPGGAIPARSRLGFSGHGTRVDVQGYGSGVVTTGYGDLQGGGINQWYTNTFGGTSGASPIVTGAAAAISSIAQQQGNLLTPRQIRDLLRTTGTPQATGTGTLSGNIGPLPDLSAAIAAMGGGQCSDDSFEHNDSQNAARRLYHGVSVAGVVCDDDWFMVPAFAGSTVSVDVTFSHAAGDVDIQLYNPAGNSVAFSNSETDNESIQHTATATGLYAVKIYGYQGATNSYRVTMNATACPPDDPFEANDTRGTARALTASTVRSASGQILDAAVCGNDDWFSFPVTDGDEITVAAAFSHGNGDVDVKLFDNTGVSVAIAESATNNESLTHEAQRTGTYTVRVYGWQGAENHYRLTVRTEPGTQVGGETEVNCPTAPTPFVDVPASSFAAAAVRCIYGLGITTGTSPTRFSPAGLVTREQMAAFIARTVRALGGTCPSGGHPFVDVSSSSFAAADIACIYRLNITTGTSPTTFDPSGLVTREQMAAFIARALRALGGTCPSGGHPFVDVSSSSFAAADIACIYRRLITTGISPTTYGPTLTVTREQMAAFLARLVPAIYL